MESECDIIVAKGAGGLFSSSKGIFQAVQVSSPEPAKRVSSYWL